jgi:hypothetical protein
MDGDALRALMISGGVSTFGLMTDIIALLGGIVALVAIAARLYPRVV